MICKINMEPRKMLAYLAIKHEGDWNKIYYDIEHRIYPEDEEFEKTVTGNFITILDNNYPQILRNAYMPPFVLFYKGDITLLDNLTDTYAIHGTRTPTKTAYKQVINCVNDNNNKTLISGLSLGIQTYALTEHKGKSIVVLANGLDNPYPTSNKELLNDIIENGGLVLTEYSSHTLPQTNNFLARNRIISALANELILIQATNGSASLVSHALNLGKDISVVPNTENNDFGNELIDEGAKPAFKWCF